MIAASVNKKQIKKTALVLLAIIILIAVIIYAAGLVIGNQGESDITGIPGETTEQREAYLNSLGYELHNNSTVAEVEVPAEFDERFYAYNEMLKTTGFDLEPFKGETINKCTYIVTNYGDEQTGVSAILLVREGTVIAGHILIEGETTELAPLFSNSEVSDESEVSNILPDISVETSQTVEQEFPSE